MKIKEKIAEGQVSFGAWDIMNSIAAAEIMSAAGFDWVVADIEHGSASISDVENFTRTVKMHGAVPMARVFDHSASSIRRVLDAGVAGIIVPMIRSVDEVKEIVKLAKYPPLGKRGVGLSASSVYGMELNQYLERANEDILVLVMLETKDAAESIEDILQISGVDGIFVGPMDLSASYGCMGDTNNERIVKALEKAQSLCKKYNKICGMHVLNAEKETIEDAIGKGFNFLALYHDAGFIASGAKKILGIAEHIDQR